ncbi:MAG TPA: hypothetical protein VF698_09245 [Thermoanaerobaculia bacterium]
MSKHNNVNPGQYKIGGREHTEGADKGDVRLGRADEQKSDFSLAEKQAKEDPNFIPGEAPVGQPGKASKKK